MRRSKVDVYLHIVWGTYQRLPMVGPDIERRVHRNIVAQIQKCRCRAVQINGTENHVHTLVKLSATITISALVQQAKGVSSTFAREQLVKGDLFGWHDGYAAFSVSRRDLPRVIQYIREQKKHHAEGTAIPEWEVIDQDADEVDDTFPEVDL